MVGAKPIDGRQAFRFVSTAKLSLRLTVGLQDTKDFVTGDKADLGNPMRVTQGNTDLGGGQALASEFPDVLNDIFWSGLQPRGRGATVWEGRGRYIL
jgi:hypothetical protein